jgi:formate dehydrogenase subunit gamma
MSDSNVSASASVAGQGGSMSETAAGSKVEYLVRFGAKQRVEHFLTMIDFVGLVITGLPQKFYTANWAQWLIGAMGGIDTVRWMHRFFGVVLIISVILHGYGAVAAILSRKVHFTMAVNKRDFGDAIQTLRYYLGLADHPARFDRYDYKQKWEYWSLMIGNVIMILSGLTLMYPTVVARIGPGEIVPAAKVAHSNEGLMAFLVITIWHVFNAHLNPDVFPFDASIFTGKISRERMEHEHPLELERLEGRPVVGHHGGSATGHGGRPVG